MHMSNICDNEDQYFGHVHGQLDHVLDQNIGTTATAITGIKCILFKESMDSIIVSNL